MRTRTIVHAGMVCAALAWLTAACGGDTPANGISGPAASTPPSAPAPATAGAPTTGSATPALTPVPASATIAAPTAAATVGATAGIAATAAPAHVAASATPLAVPAVSTPAGGPVQQRVGLDCLASVIRRHPIDLAPFDATTGRAGDVQFVDRVMGNTIFTQFGYVIPGANTSSGQDKANPQPTYLAPPGTFVRATANGVVDRISDLWSTPTVGDVSVMVKPDGLPEGCYVVVEAEHVLNPRVAVGDRVSVGQVIAEVGPLNSQGNSGLGLVEFGVLTGAGNGRPMHVCPYAYFAPDVAASQLGVLTRLFSDWETYAGDATLWDETSWIGGVPGCSSGPITE